MYRFDHLVHFVQQPGNTMEKLQEEGFHVVQGGSHEAWGTYNTLSYFDLSYIELIGIEDESKFQKAANEKYTLHESYKQNGRRNGFTRYAIRTTTIEQDAKIFAHAGLEVYGPERFTRKRSDGSVVSWRLLHIGSSESKIDFPFFIQWDEVDSIRLKEFSERGIIAPHSLGELKIEAVHIVVPNFKDIDQIAEICGATVIKKENIEANAEYTIVLLDEVKLIFAKPIADGEVWDFMLENGYGIKKVTFSGAREKKLLTIEGAQYELNTSYKTDKSEGASLK